MKEPSSIKPDWHWSTPEGSRELERLLDRRLSFRDMVQWMEETETLLLRWQAQSKKPPG